MTDTHHQVSYREKEKQERGFPWLAAYEKAGAEIVNMLPFYAEGLRGGNRKREGGKMDRYADHQRMDTNYEPSSRALTPHICFIFWFYFYFIVVYYNHQFQKLL